MRSAKQAPAKATRKAAAAKTPLAPVRKRTASRATAPANNSKVPAKRTRAAATTAAPATSGRAYRLSPDDLAAIFDEIGTVAGVAEDYQVPRHTAQGWIRCLRATA
jgi:hypothetical protein